MWSGRVFVLFDVRFFRSSFFVVFGYGMIWYDIFTIYDKDLDVDGGGV